MARVSPRLDARKHRPDRGLCEPPIQRNERPPETTVNTFPQKVPVQIDRVRVGAIHESRAYEFCDRCEKMSF